MVRHHPQYLGCSHRRTDGASSPAGQRYHAKRLPGRALRCPHTHQGDQAAFLLSHFEAAILAASNGSKSSVRPSSENHSPVNPALSRKRKICLLPILVLTSATLQPTHLLHPGNTPCRA